MFSEIILLTTYVNFSHISFGNRSRGGYLHQNNYSPNFIDSCIKSFLYTPKVMVQNLRKRNVFVKLTFLGSTSFQIRKKLQKLFSDKLMSCNLKIVFTSPVRVKSFFTFKDNLPKILLSGLVYQYKCWWLQCYLLWKDHTPF